MLSIAIHDIRYMDRRKRDINWSVDKQSATEVDYLIHAADTVLKEVPEESRLENFWGRLAIRYKDSGLKEFDDFPLTRLFKNVIHTLSGDQTFEFVSIGLTPGKSSFQIMVRTEVNGHMAVPIQYVSRGTTSVLAIFGLIYEYLEQLHLLRNEKEVPFDPKKEQGIVLIDEIDAHLHPQWQLQVVPLLRDSFPEVQFLLAAHSPLIVAGCREGEVSVLRQTEDGQKAALVTMEDHFIGATVDEIYAKVFEVEGEDMFYKKLRKDYVVHEILKKGGREPVVDKDTGLYLEIFKSIQARRNREQILENENKELKLKIQNIQGE